MIKSILFFCLLFASHVFCFEALILIGSPGSGKGTFAQIAKEHGYAHISAGDLIRDEIRQKTPLGLSIEELVKEGKYIDPEIMFRLLKNKILYYANQDMPLIVDGYGRTKEDATLLKDLLKELNADTHVLLLEASAPICQDRMIHRLVCQGCDFVSSETFGVSEDQVCPKCHTNVMQRRINDAIQVIEKRLDQYHKSVKPNYIEFLDNYPSDILSTELDIDCCIEQYCHLIHSWHSQKPKN